MSWHMAGVGIRELPQRARDLLRWVQDGESIEITERGPPVAVLAPVPEDPSVQRTPRRRRVTRH
jgi:prevent-host-death family protein